MAYTTINKSSDHFNTVLYTGDGSASDRTITGVGFQPDFLWNKSRSNAYNHYIFDVLRGTNMISSNATTAQEDKSPQFSAFTSDGFTIRNDAGSLAINASGVTFANWCWKANGAGSSNTDGSITSTVSANTTSGFSIAQWTGTGSNATIGHGLGVTPKCFLIKKTSGTSAWSMYHESVGNTKFITFNSFDVATTGSTVWNNTSPTSSVFSVGTGDNGNASGATYIGYFFAEKTGFSKMGIVDGNASSSSPPFIYTGFKPSFVMLKISETGGSDTGGAVMYDNKRYPNNLSNSPVLFGNLSNVESDAYNLEMFSNGFRFNSTSVTVNGSGNKYIYMAIAEAPLVGSNNVPTTAR